MPKFIFIPNATVSYLLDLYPSTAPSYSLRKLKADVDVPVRVSRSSDNAETDVYFDPATFDGTDMTINLNSVVGAGGTLGAWVGANDAYVSVWYGQGIANHQRQVTVSRQFKLITAGVFELQNGYIAPLANQDYMVSDSAVDFSNGYSLFIPMGGLATSTYERDIIGIDTNNSLLINRNYEFWAKHQGGLIYASSNLNPVTTFRLYSAMYRKSASKYDFYSNGVLSRSSVANTASINSRFSLNGYLTAQRESSGKFPEFVIYNEDKTTDRVAIQDNINNYYNRY